MLSELRIAQLAIIEEQTVSFGPGLNVISGETGAGKSIILEALRLVCGSRAKTELIRDGSDVLEVQALFSLDYLSVDARRELVPDEVAHDEDEGDSKELVVTRIIHRNGRSKSFINGRLYSLGILQDVVSKVVNICSQNQFIELLNPSHQLSLLDEFAGTTDLLEQYREELGERDRLKRKLEAVLQERLSIDERRTELSRVVAELEPLRPRGGLRHDLEQELEVAAHAEKILVNGGEILAHMNDDDGFIAQLHQVSSLVASLVRFDPSCKPMVESFEEGRNGIVEFEKDLGRYLYGVEVDEERLEQLREQISLIARMERKYHTDDGGLANILAEAKENLESLADEKEPEALRKGVTAQEEKARSLAVLLTAEREQAAKRLGKMVERELGELNMKGARFKVEFIPEDLSRSGAERIEFLISANRGEGCRPLRSVASGGELSRIMLVLKKLLGDRAGVNVLIFDEVDTGVSGKVARSMGEKLRDLAKQSQVLCITHLPQVASLADTHLLVEKKVGARTLSVIRELDKEHRVDEIARMLAGYEITPAVQESARELLSSNTVGER